MAQAGWTGSATRERDEAKRNRAAWRKPDGLEAQPVSEMKRSGIELHGASLSCFLEKILKKLDCIPVIYRNITPYSDRILSSMALLRNIIVSPFNASEREVQA